MKARANSKPNSSGTAAPARTEKDKPTPVSREDWLYAGLVQFAEGGEQNIRVEKIARDLGVSKGSYYWYFESRESFLNEVLEHSLIVGTEEFIQRNEESGDACDRLRQLVAAILKDRRGKDFDFYLRDLARRNELAARIIRRTESRRIDFVRKLLIQCGIDANDATVRAEIFYNYYLGWYERNKDQTLGRKELARQLDWITRITGVELAR